MKKMLTLILLSIFLMTTPAFSNEDETQKQTEEIVNILNSKQKPTIIYFFSKWCHSCRVVTPIIKNVEQNLKDKYNFVYINTDKPYSYAFSGHFKVNTIPTVFIHDSKNNKRQKIQIFNADQNNLEMILKQYYKKNYSK